MRIYVKGTSDTAKAVRASLGREFHLVTSGPADYTIIVEESVYEQNILFDSIDCPLEMEILRSVRGLTPNNIHIQTEGGNTSDKIVHIRVSSIRPVDQRAVSIGVFRGMCNFFRVNSPPSPALVSEEPVEKKSWLRRLLWLPLLAAVNLSAQQAVISTYTNTSGARITAGDSVNNALRVNCVTGCSGGGGGSVDITAVGGNAVTTTLPISGSVSGTGNFTVINAGTFATQASQTGTWNVNNISGTISLPTGAATESTLSSLNTKTPALGQALAAGSVPVVLTVAQLATLAPLSTISISQGGNTATVDGTGALKVAAAIDTTGLATSALQTTGNSTLSAISAQLPAALVGGKLSVDGTFWQATQPVSAASLPLPSGASTAAKQPALGTAGTASADVISVQGIASMTALKVDGSAVTQPVSGTFYQATQPVSIAAAVTVAQATAASLNATVVGTGTFATQATLTAETTKVIGTVNVAAAQTIAVTNAGTFATQATLQAGSAAIGKLAANSGVDIGDVDVASIAAGDNNIGNVDVLTVPADPFGVNADAASATGSISAKLRFIAATGIPVTSLPSVTVGTFPDNEPFNVAQINGVTPLMGAGNTGTGSMRVTLATDQAALATWGMAAIAGAPPTGAQLQGGIGSGATAGLMIAPTICDSWVAINGTASVELIAGVSGRRIFICSGNIQMNGGANAVSFVSGTGSVCATSIETVPGFDGSTTAANGYSFAANSGMTWAGANGAAFARTTTAGENLCILVGSATRVVGGLNYAIY